MMTLIRRMTVSGDTRNAGTAGSIAENSGIKRHNVRRQLFLRLATIIIAARGGRTCRRVLRGGKSCLSARLFSDCFT